MKRLIALLVIFVVPIATLADAPARLKKSESKRMARALLAQCNETDDVRACLVDRGAECAEMSDGDEVAHVCRYAFSMTFAKVHAGTTKPADAVEFIATYEISETRKGWRGKTRSVTEFRE